MTGARLSAESRGCWDAVKVFLTATLNGKKELGCTRKFQLSQPIQFCWGFTSLLYSLAVWPQGFKNAEWDGQGRLCPLSAMGSFVQVLVLGVDTVVLIDLSCHCFIERGAFKMGWRPARHMPWSQGESSEQNKEDPEGQRDLEGLNGHCGENQPKRLLHPYVKFLFLLDFEFCFPFKEDF